jgi:hypothetical protein
VDRVEARADPVEGTEERVLETLVAAERGDHAVEELLRARVDPARLADRSEDELALLLVELLVLAHPVDLGRRREDDARLVLRRHADDLQVRLEVELEDRHRVLHVRRGRGDRDERQHHVALLHVVLDPLVVDRDVALEEAEPVVRHPRPYAVAVEVHAMHAPVRPREDRVGQVAADEAVDAEDEHVHD